VFPAEARPAAPRSANRGSSLGASGEISSGAGALTRIADGRWLRSRWRSTDLAAPNPPPYAQLGALAHVLVHEGATSLVVTCSPRIAHEAFDLPPQLGGGAGTLAGS